MKLYAIVIALLVIVAPVNAGTLTVLGDKQVNLHGTPEELYRSRIAAFRKSVAGADRVIISDSRIRPPTYHGAILTIDGVEAVARVLKMLPLSDQPISGERVTNEQGKGEIIYPANLSIPELEFVFFRENWVILTVTYEAPSQMAVSAENYVRYVIDLADGGTALRSWLQPIFLSFDDLFKEAANQAPVPTATSVTPAADAPVAPAAAAAQL